MKGFFSKLKALKNKRKFIIIIFIIAIAVGAGIFAFSNRGAKKSTSAAEYTSANVTRGDITLKISGSGTVEPVSRYEIISLVRGEILSCNFEEGDFVHEGEVLYKIDSTDLQNTIQKQYNNISKTELTAKTNAENIANLKVKAPISGTLTDFRIKQDDTVRTDSVGTITDNSAFIATVPFNASQLKSINVGDRATIVSALYMTTLEGTVTYKSNASSVSADGSALYDVEISMQNPGALSSGISVGATVHTGGGDVKSPASGTIKSAEVAAVIPKVSGKVVKVFVRDNQYVNKGDILFQIDDTDYIQARDRTNLELQDLRLSLQSYTKELENYNIKAPIDGVVISKQYKTGDTIGGSQNSSSTLMTVANTTAMVFNLDVDELEISSVMVGQTADITADALPNETFTASVTKIAKEGTSQNGVTTYKVELTIPQPGNLISGMNVNAEIIVSESKNALIVPISAVSGIRNGQGTVLVKADLAEAKREQNAAREGNAGEQSENLRPSRAEGGFRGEDGSFQRAEGETRSEGDSFQRAEGETRSEGGYPQRTGGNTQSGNEQQQESESGAQRQGFSNTRGQTPATQTSGGGYVPLRVTVGISNSDYVEILNGLNEGDEVFYIATTSSSGRNNSSFGGMPGGGMSPMGGGNVRMQGGSFGR